MIAPGQGGDIGGGIAAYVESLQDKFSSNFKIKRITTRKHKNSIDKVYRFATAFVQTLFYLLNNNNNNIVAHIHTSARSSFFRKSIFIRLSKLFNIPVILHLHSPDFHIYYVQQSEQKKRKIKNIFQMADKVIVLSNSWKEWYIETIDQNEPQVIYNGVEDHMVSDDKISKRNNHILFLGRLGERKGTYDLIKAFKKVLAKHNDAKLLLAGFGDIEGCRKLAKSLKIDKSIEFLGWIDFKQKKKLLNSSKIYTLPSYNEGFPVSILEAMSTRLPVIASNVGGIPEEIEDNQTGFLINAGDIETLASIINKIIDDDILCDEIGDNERRRYLKHFSLDKTVKNLEREYKDVMKKISA